MSKHKPYWLKIILQIIPIFLIGFVIIISLSTLIINRTLLKISEQELEGLTLDIKNSLQVFLQTASNDADNIANNPSVKQICVDALTTDKLSMTESDQAVMKSILEQKINYSNFVLLSESKEIILSHNSNSNLIITYYNDKTDPALSPIFNKKVIPQIIVNASGKDSSISIFSVAPILIESTHIFYFAIEISANSLDDILNQYHNQRKGIVFSIKSNNNEHIKQGKIGNYLNKNSQLDIYGSKLNILAQKDLTEHYTKIKKIGIQLFLIGMLIFVVLGVISIQVVKRIYKPLESLKESIESSEIGKSESILTYNSSDIVGWLGNTYSRLIMQIKHANNQLDERDERLNHFYLATTDGIYIHHGGTPLIFNPALQNLTNYSELELHKLRPLDFLLIDEEILKASQDQKSSIFEAELRTKQGNKLQVEVQLNQVNFKGQKAESLVIRDITHRKSIEQELQQERKRQVKSVIDGQEKERQRLSRELHDGLGQNLVAIKLKLESISAEKAGELGGTLNQVKQMFSHTIEEIRRISNNLMPAALKEFSLAVVLRNLCTEIESNSGIIIGLNIGILPESIDQILKTYVYRIVQEALTNVVKHSSANKATISVFSDFSNLHLQIEDNGSGFNTANLTDSGNGLYNMKERAMLLGGKINIISSKGKGVKIIAEFPLNQSKSDRYV